MDLCGRCYESIHGADAPPGRFAVCHEQSPGVGHCIINEQNPPFKSFREFVTEPFIESSATDAVSHALNPVAQFGQRDDAYENAILVHIREPSDNAGNSITLARKSGSKDFSTWLVFVRSARTFASHEMKDATELAIGVSSAGF